jgi:AcrR family transcriptional regulator
MATRHVSRRNRTASARTRERVVAAVREMLGDGSFHEATVEQVASRAGVSRATLYQHFGSRVGLVDAMCDTFNANPALIAIREATRGGDPEQALRAAIAGTVRFWASEEAVLTPLYRAAAVDPAAQELVERQRQDRRGELQQVVRGLERAGLLRDGLPTRRAMALTLMLTSFETFVELRRTGGLPEHDVASTLQASAQSLLLGQPTPNAGAAGGEVL